MPHTSDIGVLWTTYSHKGLILRLTPPRPAATSPTLRRRGAWGWPLPSIVICFVSKVYRRVGSPKAPQPLAQCVDRHRVRDRAGPGKAVDAVGLDHTEERPQQALRQQDPTYGVTGTPGGDQCPY